MVNYPYQFITRNGSPQIGRLNPNLHPMQAIHNVLSRGRNPYLTRQEWRDYNNWRRINLINSNPARRYRRRRNDLYRYISRSINYP